MAGDQIDPTRGDPTLDEEVAAFGPEALTRDDILMGRDREYPLTPILEENLQRLLAAVNHLQLLYRQRFGEDRKFVPTSGYRPGHYNRAAGGTPNSAHLHCMALDIADPGGHIAKWIMENRNVLAECNLWLEHPDYTRGWVHVDIRRRPNRVFIPY